MRRFGTSIMAIAILCAAAAPAAFRAEPAAPRAQVDTMAIAATAPPLAVSPVDAIHIALVVRDSAVLSPAAADSTAIATFHRDATRNGYNVAAGVMRWAAIDCDTCYRASPFTRRSGVMMLRTALVRTPHKTSPLTRLGLLRERASDAG